ncbi:MAG: thioredoxin family protein [Chitinophagaceae bacterium]|nr:thioredoxin family protein [Chitinophagaceae bacterium]
MKKAFCLMAMVCLLQTSHAQPTIQPLAIGDSIPDTPLEYFNYSQPTGNFADLRDEFVIFDFWRPSCLPCVKLMPKLDSIQQAFPGLKLFLVNMTREDVEKFYRKRRDSLPWLNRLHHIVNASTLRAYFSFRTLSTYIWVRKGVLWAITREDALTDEGIRAFMRVQ